MKRCAELANSNGNPMDVYECYFCRRRITVRAGDEHPQCCPWGCERDDIDEALYCLDLVDLEADWDEQPREYRIAVLALDSLRDVVK